MQILNNLFNILKKENGGASKIHIQQKLFQKMKIE